MVLGYLIFGFKSWNGFRLFLETFPIQPNTPLRDARGSSILQKSWVPANFSKTLLKRRERNNGKYLHILARVVMIRDLGIKRCRK